MSSRYAVLDLQPGVPDSDIKKCYRVKSLLIHPDKTTNPLAPDAFDRLKKAQTELLDEKHRVVLDEAIADARMLLMRERKLTIDSEEVKSSDFAKAWRDKTKFVLIDNEQRRRRQVKGQMREEGREMKKPRKKLRQGREKDSMKMIGKPQGISVLTVGETFKKGETRKRRKRSSL